MKYLLLLLLLADSVYLSGQHVPVFRDFEQFEPLLHRKNDTTYVINFWATWCKPCVEEMPGFLKLNEKFEGEKFRMILVSLDFESFLQTKVIPFIRKHHIKPDVVLLDAPDQTKWIDRVNKQWSGAIPITIIYNRDFYFFREGTITFDELNDIITKNLKQ